MLKKTTLFQQKDIRRHWDETNELWYFSVVDVLEILTGTSLPRRYWGDLKKKLSKEGSQVYDKVVQLKLKASDNKLYKTDCLSTEDLLRLIQSVPSPKAEPFKLWLAEVGYERMEETEDPELSIERAMKTYLQKRYSKDWINQRLKSIEVRKKLTNEWKDRGIKEGLEFAILTDEITKAWSEKSVKEYKKFKNLKKENLRDNMSNLELVLTMLSEASTTEISQETEPKTFSQSQKVAQQGGMVAKVARQEIEKNTGKSIVSPQNNKDSKSILE